MSLVTAHLDGPLAESEQNVHELPKVLSNNNLESERSLDLEQSRPVELEHPRPSSTNSNVDPTSKTPPPLGKRANSKRSMHGRSQSQKKIPSRLSTSANPVKPHLNRSKSTDGISRAGRPGIKRNNRSYTKMSGLQPLTKTLLNGSLNRALGALQPLTKTSSNNSLKQYALKKTTLNSSAKGVTYLSKTHLDQSIKSNKSSNSLRGMGGVSSTSVLNSAVAGIKTSSKRGRAILKLNEDAADNEYEDLSEDSEEENDKLEAISNSELQRQFQPTEDSQYDLMAREGVKGSPEEHSAEKKINHSNTELDALTTNTVNNLTEKLSQLDSQQEFESTATKTSFHSSSDDLISKNLYGGSMLLSQSTGLTRKINTSTEPLGYASEDCDLTKNPPEKLSGIVFNTRNDEQRRMDNQNNPTRTPVPGGGSYQPNQTIFSNLQRTNTQFLTDMKQQTNSQVRELENQDQFQLPNEVAQNSKDFSQFLNTSVSGSHSLYNHDTRTQQRLWLQRENSLMDVAINIDPNKLSNFSNLSLNKLMFAHNYNGSTANIREVSGVGNAQSNWIQSSETASPRESSTASFADNSSSVTNLLYLIQSGHQNTIQSRIEFERLNREYVNVRRHLNPVAKSLNRVESYFIASKGLEVQKKQNKKGFTQNRNANSFQEFAPQWEEKQSEVTGTIARLWLDALLSSSSSSVSLQLYKQEQYNQQQSQLQYLLQSNPSSSLQKQQLYHQQLQQQQQEEQQLRAYRHNISTTPNRTMAPTTRAVKMAAQAAAATPQGQR